jgi:hypothetical protein
MNIENLSIIELKQLLARVNHDLKMNKPTIKRVKKPIKVVDNEFLLCNDIAKRFTGNKQVNQVVNGKLKADIQIQKDILEFMHNGGMIIERKPRKSVKSFSLSLCNRVTL